MNITYFSQLMKDDIFRVTLMDMGAAFDEFNDNLKSC